MSKNAASEDKLGRLHDALADNLLTRLINGEEVWDSKSGEFIKLTSCTTQTLNVIARFLNDNDITCVADEANAIGTLQRAMDERKKGRKALQDGAKVVDLASALNQ